MNARTLGKPAFTKDQLITASAAAKNFGDLRKKAKSLPLFITDNGNVDTVLLSYEYYEQMYQRLVELEEREEAKVLGERIEQLERDPSIAVPWRSVRRSGRKNE